MIKPLYYYRYGDDDDDDVNVSALLRYDLETLDTESLDIRVPRTGGPCIAMSQPTKDNTTQELSC
jgi:hypothetical protein